MAKCSTKWSCPPGFTLVELLVVVTLLALIATMTVIALPSIAPHKRLTAAASQCAMIDRLARTEALASGVPRAIRYQAAGGGIAILRPKLDEGEIAWTAGGSWMLEGGVRVQEVEFAEPSSPSDEGEHWSVYVHADGSSPDYNIRLGLGADAVRLTVDGASGQGRVVEGSEDLEQDD